MSEKDETIKAISLQDIDVKNLPEFKDAIKEQEQLVINHPFVEITDSESYKKAKEARTAYVKARAKYSNDDKSIASFLVSIRKKSGELLGKIVDVSKPHETKQQDEVTRWEDLKKAEKKEEDRIEKERIDNLKKIISDFKDECIAKIKVATLENIEELAVEITDSEREVFEYEDMLQEAKDDLFLIISEKRQALDAAETQRIENDRLAKEREKLEAEKGRVREENRLYEIRRVKGDARRDIMSKIDEQIDYDTLADMPDDEWDKTYEEAKEYYEEIQQKHKDDELEKERIQKEQSDKLKADQEKFKLEQESLIFQKREVVLNKKALFYNDETGCFENVYTSIDASEVKTSDDATFAKLLANAIKIITEKLEEVNNVLLKDIGEARQNDLSKVGAERPIEELSKMSEEEFQTLLSTECKAYEAFLENEKKLQDEKEEEEQKRIEALKPDIQKLKEFEEMLGNINFPILSTIEGVKQLEVIHEDFRLFMIELNTSIDRLK